MYEEDGCVSEDSTNADLSPFGFHNIKFVYCILEGCFENKTSSSRIHIVSEGEKAQLHDEEHNAPTKRHVDGIPPHTRAPSDRLFLGRAPMIRATSCGFSATTGASRADSQFREVKPGNNTLQDEGQRSPEQTQRAIERIEWPGEGLRT